MTRFSALAIASVAFTGVAYAQGRPIDWTSYGGDAQRTGWEKSDSRITKENVKDFQLVLKRNLDNQETGQHSLTPPVIIGNLISYRGFKELAIMAGSSGNVWAIDADMDRMFWQKHLDSSPDTPRVAKSSCSGAMIATPALTPPLNFGAGRGPRRPATPGAPPTAAGAPAPASGRVGGTGFGRTRSVFVLARDGMLRQINSADGSDQFPPLKFVPPAAVTSNLTLQDGVVYTTTSADCGGAANGFHSSGMAEV
jgi:hypothetical protein